MIGCSIAGALYYFTRKPYEWRPPPSVLYLKLEFSKLPVVNETVDIRWSIKIASYSAGLVSWGEIILAPGYSDGLEWIEGERVYDCNVVGRKIAENYTGPGLVTWELNESYLKYKYYQNVTDAGAIGEEISFGGKIKATKTGNWTIVAYYDQPSWSIEHVIHGLRLDGRIFPWCRSYVTLCVGENTTSIQEEYIFGAIGAGGLPYKYYYNANSPGDHILATAVDNFELSWITGGHEGWMDDGIIYYYGATLMTSARSGTIRHNQESFIQTTVTGPGELKFYWRVDSEEGHDFLTFYIDGTEQIRISGLVHWHQKSYFIPEGRHTLQWKYTKDGSGSAGSDCGWLDKVEFNATKEKTTSSPSL